VNKERGVKLYIHKTLFVSKLALVAVLVFAVVRTVTLNRGTAEIFAPSQVSAKGNSDPAEISTRRESPPTDYSAIVEQNIFSAVQRSSASTANNAALHQAGPQLGLELIGTVAGSPSVARAIIREPGTNIPRLYKTGDIVAAASIQSIEKDAVVLRHNGQTKVLSMQVGKTGQGDAGKKTTVSQNTRPAAKTTKSDSPLVTRTGLNGIQLLLRDAVIKPYNLNGEVQGLRIAGLENVPGAEQTGLRNGDVIKSVNGNRLTSKKKAVQVFKKARSGPSITVELLRGEQTSKLTFLLK
jgi:type II secretion system protein C